MKNFITFTFVLVIMHVSAQQQVHKIDSQSVTIDGLIEYVVSDFTSNKKTNITLLVETKSTQVSRNKIFFLKQATHLLGKRLAKQSKITLVTYNKTNGLVLKPTDIAHVNLIQTRITRFKIKNNEAVFGIDLAHQYANQNYIANGSNIILMIRDGENFEVDELVETKGNQSVKTGAIISAIGLLPEIINAIKK